MRQTIFQLGALLLLLGFLGCDGSEPTSAIESNELKEWVKENPVPEKAPENLH